MKALLRCVVPPFVVMALAYAPHAGAQDRHAVPFVRWDRSGEGARRFDGLGLGPIRAIAQRGAIYFLVDKRPDADRLTFPRLNNIVHQAWWDVAERAPTAVPGPELTGSEYRRPFVPPRERLLKFTQTPTEWTISLDASVRYPAVVVLDLEGEPLLADERYVLHEDPDGVLTLPAHHAVVHGEKLQFEPLPHKNTVGYWVNPQDWAEWHLMVGTAGAYDVHVLQGCGAGQGGSEVTLSTGDSQIAFTVEETGHFQNFRWRQVGRLELAAGRQRLEVRCRKLARNAVMDVRQIRLVPAGHEPQVRDCREVAPDIYVPPLTLDGPAAGRRLLLQAPNYESTAAYHVLTLPTDWNANRKFPVMVEFTGNGPYRTERDLCTGRVEDAKLGYGLAGSDGFLCLSLPYLNAAGTANVTQWWGSPPDHRPDTTIEYARRAIDQTCRQFGGDPDALILVGFSRGALACNAIGLHDDQVAPLWRAMICFSHYDGVRRWPYAESDAEAARRRLARLGDRPQFVCSESQAQGAASLDAIRAFLQTSGVDTTRLTFAESGFANHDDAWVLRPSATRTTIREWLQAVLKR